MGKGDFSKFMAELGLILEIAKGSGTWCDLSTAMREDDRLKNVSLEGVKLLRETIELKLPEGQGPNERGGYDVCGALEEMRAIFRDEGRLEGKREGRLEGKQEGRQELALQLMREKMERRGMTAREAAEDLGLDPVLAEWCATALSGGDGSGA